MHVYVCIKYVGAIGNIVIFKILKLLQYKMHLQEQLGSCVWSKEEYFGYTEVDYRPSIFCVINF